VKDVSIQTSWNCGCHLMEKDCEILRDILCGLEENPDVNILAPFGTLLFLLFDVPLLKVTLMKVWNIQHHLYHYGTHS